MMKRLFAALAFTTILSGHAIAQEEDGSGDAAQPTCEVSANWRVVLTELGDVPGMTMDLNKRDASGQPDCKTKDVKADFTVGGPDQVLWFTFLSNDFLVMARSTGPIGNVVIQNLNDKTIVLDVVSDDSQADSWGVTYWEQKEAGTAETCAQFAEYKEQGFGAVMAHEMRFDFATKTSLVSGKVNCEPAQ
jgi:hypothetical protein